MQSYETLFSPKRCKLQSEAYILQKNPTASGIESPFDWFWSCNFFGPFPVLRTLLLRFNRVGSWFLKFLHFVIFRHLYKLGEKSSILLIFYPKVANCVHVSSRFSPIFCKFTENATDIVRFLKTCKIWVVLKKWVFRKNWVFSKSLKMANFL